MTPREVLKQYDLTQLDLALKEHPSGPVICPSTRSSGGITYEVKLGERKLWERIVYFGKSDKDCAAGSDFVRAARDQDAIAFALLELLEEGVVND